MGSFKFNLITLLLICTTELSAQLAPEKGSNITGNITSTHLMELDKFMNMTKAKIDNNCALGLYFNFFGDDDLYIYNIRDINTIECEVISL